MLKKFIRDGRKINNRENYLQSVEAQTIAVYFANLFTTKSKGQVKRVKFLKAKVFYFKKEKFKQIMCRYYTLELFFEGTFTYFNVKLG